MDPQYVFFNLSKALENEHFRGFSDSEKKQMSLLDVKISINSVIGTGPTEMSIANLYDLWCMQKKAVSVASYFGWKTDSKEGDHKIFKSTKKDADWVMDMGWSILYPYESKVSDKDWHEVETIFQDREDREHYADIILASRSNKTDNSEGFLDPLKLN